MKIIIIFLLLSLTSHFYSQDITLLNVEKEEWKLYSEGEVNIYYKITSCTIPNLWDQERVLLKFENTTKKQIEFSYQKELSYSNSKNKTYDKPVLKLKFSSLEVIQGTCKIDETNEVYIFSKSIDPRVIIESELLKFNLKNTPVK